MKANFIRSRQELRKLAPLIQVSAESWRGVAYYSLRPKVEGDVLDVSAMIPGDKPLCFEGNSGSIIYLGKPIADLAALPVGVCAMVPDISASPHLALALLHEETGEPEASGAVVDVRKDETKPLRVLLADDDPMTRKLIEGFLAKHVKTLTVENPRQASANFAVLRPDIAFLDIHYQDQIHDGFDVLRSILSANQDAYVVIISGDGCAATVYKALSEGAKGFIAKPLRAESFYVHLDKVATVLSKCA